MVLHIFKCPKDGINNGVSSVVSFFLFSIIFEEIYWIGILSGKRVYGSILTRGFASLFFSILSSHSCTSVSQVFWLNLLILLFFAVFCFLRVLQVYFTILLLKLLFWFFSLGILSLDLFYLLTYYHFFHHISFFQVSSLCLLWSLMLEAFLECQLFFGCLFCRETPPPPPPPQKTDWKLCTNDWTLPTKGLLPLAIRTETQPFSWDLQVLVFIDIFSSAGFL